MSRQKGCKICHATTLELDSTGRCLGCATVLKASERKMSYGKYMALKSQCEPVETEAEEWQTPTGPFHEEDWHRCAFCGKLLFSLYPRQRFCSKDCQTFQHRIDARNRARTKSGQTGDRLCAVCGAVMPWDFSLKRKTCSAECKAQYVSQQRREKYAREKAGKAAQNG